MNSYDEVPYDNLACARTHPDRLATAARIFGLRPPPIASCRVLELGCASGGNLIPMAFNLPGAEFVGIDLSRRQIEHGCEIISAVGITNAALRHASILDVTKEWGEFDYVICHGVFSWVESHVQDAILRIANENLSPTGVAYISYNTYPGWHVREMVRHMMRYHVGQFDEPQERIEQARALLTFLVSASHQSGAYGELLGREVERLSRASDSYLYHEHLEQTNTPFYFHQFIERVEAAGLQYLAEADVSDMLSSAFPANVAETLERISPDILHLEQYMDFVRNRLFRQTLLCHKGLHPKRALSPAVLRGLMMSCGALTDPASPDLTPMTPVVFKAGHQHAEVALPASKAVFSLLMEAWPRAVDVDDLCTMALRRAAPFLSETPPDQARGTMMSDLFAGVVHGLIHLHTQQLSCTNRPSDTPRAHPLAAFQAAFGNVVVNAHHEMHRLDPLGVEVLKLANGERSRSQMLAALIEQHAGGRLVMEENGERITSPELPRAVLEDRLEKALASLTRSAVLI
jgi:methyltransferase-like protein/SAM-dependent methyltransferase